MRVLKYSKIPVYEVNNSVLKRFKNFCKKEYSIDVPDSNVVVSKNGSMIRLFLSTESMFYNIREKEDSYSNSPKKDYAFFQVLPRTFKFQWFDK